MWRAVLAACTLLLSLLALVAAAIGYLVAGGTTAILEILRPDESPGTVAGCSGGTWEQLNALLDLEVCTALQGSAKVALLAGGLSILALAFTDGRTGRVLANIGYLLGAAVVTAGTVQAIAAFEHLTTAPTWHYPELWMDVLMWTVWTGTASILMLVARWAAPPTLRHAPRRERRADPAAAGR